MPRPLYAYALAHARKSGRRVVSAFIATAFAQTMPRTQLRNSARSPINSAQADRACRLLDEAETDVLAYTTFPRQHRAKLHSTDEMDKRFFMTAPR